MPPIIEFPHRLQGFDYDCGPTAVMTVLHYFGKRVNEQEVIDALNTTHEGTATEEIEEGLKKFGIEFQNVNSIAEIDKHLEMGHPILVCSQTDPKDWHYSVLVSRRGDEYITSDPWEIGLASIPVSIFDQIWLEEDGTKWGVAVFGEPKYTEAIHPLEVRLARTAEGRKLMATRRKNMNNVASDLLCVAKELMSGISPEREEMVEEILEGIDRHIDSVVLRKGLTRIRRVHNIWFYKMENGVVLVLTATISGDQLEYCSWVAELRAKRSFEDGENFRGVDDMVSNVKIFLGRLKRVVDRLMDKVERLPKSYFD